MVFFSSHVWMWELDHKERGAPKNWCFWTVALEKTLESPSRFIEPPRFYEDLQDLLELTPTKDVLFIKGDWNAKVGSQETPGVTGKFGLGRQNEAGQSLIEFCQENALVIANILFQQHKRRLYTWTSQDGQHRNQIDYILCSQRWRSSIQLAKTRPGADCGSDHELLITKLRLKLKKVGKTARPFRYGKLMPLICATERSRCLGWLDGITAIPSWFLECLPETAPF